ncbi:MAG: acyl-CoA thioesterase [bacterium]|nr:acyl-CoA thioesterase [bacterium]
MTQSLKKAEPVSTIEIVFPEDSNHFQSLFGGRLLAWMDKVSYYAAFRYAGFPAVTASVESLDFSHSPKVGDVLDIVARVIHTGRSSMVIKVDVFCQDVQHRKAKVLSNTGLFNFVALNEAGQPQPIPPLLVETDEEKELWELGERVKAVADQRRRSSQKV